MKASKTKTDVKRTLEETLKRVGKMKPPVEEPAKAPGSTLGISIKDTMARSLQLVEALHGNKRPLAGIPTGFVDLDTLTNGLQPSDLIIIAGRPSVGKTSLALNIAQYVSMLPENSVTVGIFSLEMSGDQLMMRVLSSEAEIDLFKMRTGRLSREDWPGLIRASGRINDASANLIIDDTPPSMLPISELCYRAKLWKKRRNVGLIVIDYLQLMCGDGDERDTREQELSEITRLLKSLAKELNIPVIALSQVNRALETRENKRPRLYDLRDAGAIEEDADVIMFIYRDEVYNKDKDDNKGVAEIILAKHRNGPVGVAELTFIDKYVSFRNTYRLDE